MTEAQFDIAVIGAGIHGAGVAQAAAAAGHSVLVLEQTAIAAGTSSRSSKLIHGGLRYLETGQVRLVRESLRERALLLRLAPKLVQLRAFYLPVYATSRRRSWEIRGGLSAYALLGGLTLENRFRRLRRSEWDRLDGLDRNGLRAVFRYFDAQTDDARLTAAVLESARSLGARIRVPARFERASRTSDAWRVAVEEAGAARTVSARVLVNCAGPWVAAVQESIETAPAPLPVSWVQGAHLVLDYPLHAGIYYLEALDRRGVFAMPWRAGTLLGTTETAAPGPDPNPQPTHQEIGYLLDTFARYFCAKRPAVHECFAGIRVLPDDGKASALRRSRKVRLQTDRPHAPRLVSVYGGKLTTYRATAQKIIQRLQGSLPPRPAIAATDELPLHVVPDDR